MRNIKKIPLIDKTSFSFLNTCDNYLISLRTNEINRQICTLHPPRSWMVLGSFSGRLACRLCMHSSTSRSQGCRSLGGPWKYGPPNLGRSVKLISIGGEQIMHIHITTCPRIFRPSYSPELGRLRRTKVDCAINFHTLTE